MAGRNFWRYMSSVVSALFAPFTFLFTRILQFFAWPQPNNTSPSEPSSAALPGSSHQDNGPARLVTATSHRTISSSSSPSSPTSARPATVQHHHNQLLHTTAAGRDVLNGHNTAASPDTSDHNCNTAVLDNSDSLSFAPTSSSHDLQHPHPDMAGKRGGNRRGGGAKASALRPAAGTPGTAVTETNLNIAQSESTPSGNTKPIPDPPNGTRPIFATPKQGSTRGRERTIPAKSQGHRHKENFAPPVQNGVVQRTAHSNTPALHSTASTNDAAQPETGARSQPAVPLPDVLPASAAKDMGDEEPTDSPADHVKHPTPVANRLTLSDTTPCQEPVAESLREATTAAEASALPVPLVVAVPLPPQLKPAEPDGPPNPMLPGLIEPKTPEEKAEREYHLKYMREALDMGLLALNTNETPVGCVLVYRGRTIAKGMNATNITRNGTRHAEFMALSALLSRRQSNDVAATDTNHDLDDASWGDIDPKDGHIFPYGQKLHPAPVVNRSIISECVLYVTVEPCVMCASLLRQLGIKKVYFGAVNDKFGGTGGVFRVHMNSKPVDKPQGRPYQRGYGPHDVDCIAKGKAVALPREEDDGDGGNVEAGYPVEGGYLRDDAVGLLRRFYVQENGRAPQPRKKEGRAARLYAAMGIQEKGEIVSDSSEAGPDTPVDPEPATRIGTETAVGHIDGLASTTDPITV